MLYHFRSLCVLLTLCKIAGATPILGNNPAIPGNFQVQTFASGLNFPYGLYQLPDGSILAGTINGSLFGSTLEITRITQTNGLADAPTVVFSGGTGPATGMSGVGNIVAVATGTGTGSQINILEAGAGGSLTQLGQLNFTYPGPWWHDSHAISMRAAPGQPGTYQLIFNVGSEFNDIPSVHTVSVTGLTSATLNPDSIYSLSFTVNGSNVTAGAPTQLASGLRNAFALGFHSNGDIYFGENGIDLNGNVPLSPDYFGIIPAGSSILNFGFPSTYYDPITGQMVGSGVGITTPLTKFLPINGQAIQGVGGLSLSPSNFPAGLNGGAFLGFFGNHAGGAANNLNGVVYVDATTGQYFDFLPGAQTGVGHPVSFLSTADALYIADLSTIGSNTQNNTGVIYRVSAADVPEPSTAWLIASAAVVIAALRRRRSASHSD